VCALWIRPDGHDHASVKTYASSSTIREGRSVWRDDYIGSPRNDEPIESSFSSVDPPTMLWLVDHDDDQPSAYVTLNIALVPGECGTRIALARPFVLVKIGKYED
jgi:hypothetical protein